MTANFAEVYLNLKTSRIDSSFDYLIPVNLKKNLKTGSLVIVPFGKRLEVGFVNKIKDLSSFKETSGKEIREIKDILFSKPFLDKNRLKLAYWLAFYYISSIGSALKLFMPPGYNLKFLKIKPKLINVFKLNEEEILKPDKAALIKSNSQKQILNYLKLNPLAEAEKILKAVDATRYSLTALVNKNLVIKEKIEVRRDFNYNGYSRNNFKDEIKLNSYQKNCINKITGIIKKNMHHKFLIEGVTGSGKTEVYIRCVKEAIKNKKSALILTPEISLTPQLYSNFKNVFPVGLAVYHSGMNDNERYEKWLDILEGNVNIVIGTRSAIFTPIQNLGIIIVDEEHDPSYKENFGLRYNAQNTVMKLAEILKIPVVFGSATPSLTLKYKLSNDENSTVLKMPEKIFKNNEVSKQIVDLRKINRSREDEIITDELFNNIKEVTEKREKAIIFINRRGYSNFIICNECGHIPKCKNCNLAYVFHITERKLKCHHCGSEVSFNNICQSCNSKRITLYGTGIQKVEAKLKQRFHDIPVIRMDSDVTSVKKSHEEILNKFISQNPSILIGTQMISKGLDIKDVTLVGVINTDSMLSLPDYHINERVFALLTQVSGRTGRSNRKCKVIVQTFNPESIIIKSFTEGSYEEFCTKELANRRELDYPPFSSLINIVVSGKNEKTAQSETVRLYNMLKDIKGNDSYQILGPSPAPFAKLNQFYRWHILIKTFKINRFISRFTKLIKMFKIEKECKLIIDVDPVWIL